MPLTPQAIYEDFMNHDLDKSVASELLITLIDNAENNETRKESIKIIDKIKVNNEKTFKFLEHLVVSDSNEEIRVLAWRVLKNHYLEKSLVLISWVLKHEKSLKCLIICVSTLAEINTEESKSILIEKINSFYKNGFEHNLKFLKKKESLTKFSSNEIANLIINYYVLSYLKTAFGYIKFKVDDSALIVELDLSNVESYDSKFNKLEYYLTSILSLTNLKKLDLRFNRLTRVSEVFKNTIEDLDLGYNKIVKLPDFNNLKSLKILNLKSNRLREIPISIGVLSSLEHLNLRNNMLTDLPLSIISLSSLKTLDLHGNKLLTIKVNLNTSLKELELGWNNFTELPDIIQDLSSIEKLGIGGNKISRIPEWIGTLNLLRELDIYDNSITQLPDSFGALSSLKALNLRNNQLTNLPKSFKNLKSLRKLNLSWNNLRSLPEWIDELTSLEVLNLWGNKLEDLPESISFLSHLKILDLNFNRFEHSPLFLNKLKGKKDLIIKF